MDNIFLPLCWAAISLEIKHFDIKVVTLVLLFFMILVLEDVPKNPYVLLIDAAAPWKAFKTKSKDNSFKTSQSYKHFNLKWISVIIKM